MRVRQNPGSVAAFQRMPPTQHIIVALVMAALAGFTWFIAGVGLVTASFAVFFSAGLLRSRAPDRRIIGAVAMFISVSAMLAAIVVSSLVAYAVVSGPTTGTAGTAVEPQQD